jgi:hypothetical protein
MPPFAWALTRYIFGIAALGWCRAGAEPGRKKMPDPDERIRGDRRLRAGDA